MPDTIPDNLIDAIASSTAMAVGEQPAILANLALANQIANTNLAQQNAISNQQAMFHLELTTVSKCVEMIASINPTSGGATQQIEAFQKIMEMFAQMSQKPGAAQQPQQQAAPAPPSAAAKMQADAGNADAGAGVSAARSASRKRTRRPSKKRPPPG